MNILSSPTELPSLRLNAMPHQKSRPVWLNKVLMSSISNGHPTLKSWCWTTLLFDAISYFAPHAASSVSSRFRILIIRKILHSNQICLSQSVSSVSKRIRMLSTQKILFNNQIFLLQSVPSESRQIRVLITRKTLCSNCVYLLQSDSLAAVNAVHQHTFPYAEQT